MQRRHFLQKSGASLLGLTLFSGFKSKPIAPSDKLRVAHIGVNGMGTSHLKWFAALPEVEIVGLCDVDKNHLTKAQKTLQELHPNNKAEVYGDFRRILDRKDVDAITCATPDHWHAQIAILAFEAGKDVYGEKPLSYSVKEGQMMLKSMKKHKRIFQLGTQIHAGENYHRVAEIIQSGAIGKVKTVKLWKTGSPPVLGPSQFQNPPAELDYNFWLGPAPYTPYTPEKVHFSYRYYLDYSGGIFQDFWCHIADIVWWSINPQNLKSIEAKGGLPEGNANTPDWIEVDYEFEDLKIHWSSKPPTEVAWAKNKHIGAYFIGEKGTLVCDYFSKEITINDVVMTDIKEIPKTIERSKGHQKDFVDAVKNRTQPQSNLEYARQMTLPMHLGLIAWRLGRKLEWNTQKEKFKHDSEANSYLFREYRKGWDWI